MNDKPSRVITVGEVMVELARGDDGRYSLAYGGDTFNTAVYLARAGLDVAYATALGDDRYSDGIVDLAAVEGVGREMMVRLPGRMPGLYLIETDRQGERTFHYWRQNSPARELFETPDWSLIAQGLLLAKLVYFSGVTLSLYSNVGIGRFLAALELARQNGVKVAFDTNYRPIGWNGDVARARTVFNEAFKRADLVFPSFDDEAVLWGDASPEATVDRLQAFGIEEIVVKNGADPALVATRKEREFVPVNKVVEPIDTTAAGDSFNAGYIAARLRGEELDNAVRSAHATAGDVVMHRGAIVPRAHKAMH
jgi:2-dehydro-3-deoxygluconokinase